MKLAYRSLAAAPIVALVLPAFCQPACAQFAAFTRLFRPHHQVALAQLPEVADALKLTDEQKNKAVELNDAYNQERGALFQEAQGDFDSIREDMAKLTKETADKFNESLDDAQKKRLQEVYVQANGGTALFDDAVAAALKITDEQKGKLDDVRNEIRDEMFSGGLFQDMQNLSEEESAKKIDEVLAEQDEKYMAVLTEEQKAELGKLKGEELKLDLNNLPSPFGR
jgi:Spy/CpxP family protein refolding chaperone